MLDPYPQSQPREQKKFQTRQQFLSKLSDEELAKGLNETPSLGTVEYTMLFAEALARLLRRNK